MGQESGIGEQKKWNREFGGDEKEMVMMNEGMILAAIVKKRLRVIYVSAGYGTTYEITNEAPIPSF